MWYFLFRSSSLSFFTPHESLCVCLSLCFSLRVTQRRWTSSKWAKLSPSLTCLGMDTEHLVTLWTWWSRTSTQGKSETFTSASFSCCALVQSHIVSAHTGRIYCPHTHMMDVWRAEVKLSLTICCVGKRHKVNQTCATLLRSERDFSWKLRQNSPHGHDPLGGEIHSRCQKLFVRFIEIHKWLSACGIIIFVIHSEWTFNDKSTGQHFVDCSWI